METTNIKFQCTYTRQCILTSKIPNPSLFYHSCSYLHRFHTSVALEASNKGIKSMLTDLLLLCHCYWYVGGSKIYHVRLVLAISVTLKPCESM